MDNTNEGKFEFTNDIDGQDQGSVQNMVMEMDFKVSTLAPKLNHLFTYENRNVISTSRVSKILREDMNLIRLSYVTDCNTPRGLQNTVFLNLMLHFGFSAYGRRSLRDMKTFHFSISTDTVANLRFVSYVNKDKGTSTSCHFYREGDNGDLLMVDEFEDEVNYDKIRMYENSESPQNCPVSSFEKYLAKLNKMSDAFWQKPLKQPFMIDHQWYESSAVGINSLGYRMRDIAREVGCSQIYSNQSLKITSKACRTQMYLTGSKCTCSANHFNPSIVNYETSYHDNEAFSIQNKPFRDQLMGSDPDVKTIIKLEPDDNQDGQVTEISTTPDAQEVISVRSGDSESSPEASYYLSMPNLSGDSTQNRVRYSMAPSQILSTPPLPLPNQDKTPHASASTTAAFSPPCPTENHDQVIPVRITSVHVDENPHEHTLRELARIRHNDQASSWKVESSWLNENNQRSWLLTENFLVGKKKWILNQDLRSNASKVHASQQTENEARQSIRSPNLTNQNCCSSCQRSSPSNASTERSHACKQSCKKLRGILTSDCSCAEISTSSTDSEVLQLQKDVLRMQKVNLALDRRKMELKIAKLEGECLRTKAGS